MANELSTASAGAPALQKNQAYTIAVVCLAAGLGIGYLLQGWNSLVPWAHPTDPAGQVINPTNGAGLREMTTPSGPSATPAVPPGHPAPGMGNGKMPSLEALKQMADKQAEPLLEQLKKDPKNEDLLIKIGAVYHTTHQFKEAAAYYGRAIEADPKNVSNRTRLASSLYRSGDVDGAIVQLNRALSYDPNEANALFDLGMIRLHGKQDSKGALGAWRRLLKGNPQMSSERRATVEKLIADVTTSLNDGLPRKGGAR